MKKYILLLVSVLTFAACQDGSKQDNPNNKKTGSLSLTLEAKDNFTTKAAEISIADFSIVIKNADGSVWRSWDKFGEGITINDIPEGNYTLEAFYGKDLIADWESPYYFGETAFSINADQTTEVEVVSTLANAKITITYSDKLLAELDEIQVLVTGKNGGALTYTPTETRSGYFAIPENNTVKVYVTGVRKSNTEALQQIITITDFQAAQWHKINVALQSTAGTGAVSLTIDRTLIEKNQSIEIPELDDITGGQPTPDPDPEPTVKPTIEGSSYNGTPFNIDQPLTVSAASVTELNVLISATDGIKNLFVKIMSPTIPQEDLESMGLGGVFDMANPGFAAEALEELGLIDPSNPILGKTAHTFSIGGFMAMLSNIGGVGKEHQFEIEVVGTDGNKTKKTLIVNLID